MRNDPEKLEISFLTSATVYVKIASHNIILADVSEAFDSSVQLKQNFVNIMEKKGDFDPGWLRIAKGFDTLRVLLNPIIRAVIEGPFLTAVRNDVNSLQDQFGELKEGTEVDVLSYNPTLEDIFPGKTHWKSNSGEWVQVETGEGKAADTKQIYVKRDNLLPGDWNWHDSKNNDYRMVHEETMWSWPRDKNGNLLEMEKVVDKDGVTKTHYPVAQSIMREHKHTVKLQRNYGPAKKALRNAGKALANEPDSDTKTANVNKNLALQQQLDNEMELDLFEMEKSIAASMSRCIVKCTVPSGLPRIDNEFYEHDDFISRLWVELLLKRHPKYAKNGATSEVKFGGSTKPCPRAANHWLIYLKPGMTLSGYFHSFEQHRTILHDS